MRLVVAVGLLLASSGLLPTPAQAAPVPARYGAWTFAGTSTDYTGTVDLGVGFPAITMATDSRTPPGASAANPSGAISTSAVIRANSAFGATYGTSQGQQYVNLRPRADGNAQSPGTPSVTTYTFAGPTPTGTWGIVLGDIDAETLTVTATDPAGAAVSGADLGAAGFNYCGTPASATCAAGLTTPTPTVVVGAASVTAADPLCPPADCNTNGAALSLAPTVPLRTVTVASKWRQGFPSYQTWFATRTSTISGRVTAPCAQATPPTARLLDAGGAVVTTTPTAADGTYSFAGVAADNYRVDVDPTTLPGNAEAEAVDVDATGADATAPDITVRTRVTVAGAVQRSGAGTAVIAGLPVTLVPDNGKGTDRRTSTDARGRYAFDDVMDGRYRVVVDPVGRDAVTPRERSVVVGCAAVEVPAFDVVAAPDTSSPTGSASSGPATSASGSSSASPAADNSGSSPAPGRDASGPEGRAGLADTGSSVRQATLLGMLAFGAGLLLVGAVLAVRPAAGPRRRARPAGRHR